MGNRRIREQFEGCILGGAIGDAFGSAYENQITEKEDIYYPFGPPKTKQPKWQITDDTQLTLATIEALVAHKTVDPEAIAHRFLHYFRQGKLVGIGASTLKSLEGLSFGGHWSQVGRSGEFAAGNGAAMRIAPLAFKKELTNTQIRDVCSITHKNDEAYVGAKSVVVAIRKILSGQWHGDSNLIALIIEQLPDTRVRDRLIEIKDKKTIQEVGAFGTDGYVVNSVPLAIAAANRVHEIGMEHMFSQLIALGGDTDTNCSIAGQIAGALIGKQGIPDNLLHKLQNLGAYEWIEASIHKFIKTSNWP